MGSGANSGRGGAGARPHKPRPERSRRARPPATERGPARAELGGATPRAGERAPLLRTGPRAPPQVSPGWAAAASERGLRHLPCAAPGAEGGRAPGTRGPGLGRGLLGPQPPRFVPAREAVGGVNRPTTGRRPGLGWGRRGRTMVGSGAGGGGDLPRPGARGGWAPASPPTPHKR